jgi:glycosyltransferase involved in cell wall biosynthesis
MKPKLLYLITEDWFFCSHFIERAVAAKSAGYDVVVIAREQNHGDRIRAAGLRLIPIDFARHGMNAVKELKLLLEIFRIYKHERPNIVHHIAVKPILYGTIAARLMRVRAIINAPVGMGYAFSSRDISAQLIRFFLRIAYRAFLNPVGSRVIFENPDDLESFISDNTVKRSEAVLIRGAGIDLVRFSPQAEEPSGCPVVVLIARMLRDKGVNEFVSAAKLLCELGIKGRFVLVGNPDPGNPASISAAVLKKWDGQNGVEWWGWREDIAKVLAEATIACLPSYREGLPKFLLEAAACGLPIVTTNTQGCRDVVVDEDNGLLVPVREVQPLALALKRLLLDSSLRRRMGGSGRIRVEEKFSLDRVIAETLAVYAEMGRQHLAPFPHQSSR